MSAEEVIEVHLITHGVHMGKTQYRSCGISGMLTTMSSEDRSINKIEYIVSAFGRTTPTPPGSFGSGSGRLTFGFRGTSLRIGFATFP